MKYKALRTISNILRVFAYIILILGGLGVLIGTIVTGSQAGFGLALGVLIGGAIYVGLMFMALLAGSEQIMVTLDTEENTRNTAFYVKQLLEK
jgi:hypothetical protein